MEMTEVFSRDWKAFIDQHCLTKVGKFNNRCAIPTWWPNKGFANVLSEIMSDTATFPPETSLAERLHAVYYNLTSAPRCPVCQQEPCGFKQFHSGYWSTCSITCSGKNPVRTQKIQTTTNERQGPGRAQTLATIRKTCQEKYGVDYTWELPEMQNKARQTRRERYGNEHYHNQPKIKETNTQRYGVPWTTLDEGVKAKIRKTMYEKYDGRWSSQIHISSENLDILNDITKLVELNKAGNSLEAIAQQLGVSYRNVWLKFQQANIEPVFYPTTGPSQAQLQVSDWLQTHTSVNICDRSIIGPKELDIYLPDHKLAIEYHGQYWHSYGRHETPQERHRHQVKYQLCQERGIRLLQIFEQEWLQKKEQWQSIILRAIGKIPNTIGARQTQLQQIDFPTATKFLQEHHLHGSTTFRTAYGLYDQMTLLAVLTLSVPRFGHKGGIEISRIATHSDWTVTGGTEKLIKHVLQTETKSPIISYSNNRLFTGKVFEKMGFRNEKETPPSYLYIDTKTGNTLSRYQAQKKHLAKLLPNFDPTLTEAENMFAHGYRRMWDAGHKCWTYISDTPINSYP